MTRSGTRSPVGVSNNETYLTGGGLNHFPSSSAFHLPSHLGGGGGGGGDKQGGGGSPPTHSSSNSSHFVGLSVANAHHLQLEWLARNGMLYPRLPDLAGELFLTTPPASYLVYDSSSTKGWN